VGQDQPGVFMDKKENNHYFTLMVKLVVWTSVGLVATAAGALIGFPLALLFSWKTSLGDAS